MARKRFKRNLSEALVKVGHSSKGDQGVRVKVRFAA